MAKKIDSIYRESRGIGRRGERSDPLLDNSFLRSRGKRHGEGHVSTPAAYE